MFYSDCTVPKLCCFSASDNHGQTSDAFDFHNMAFKIVRLEVADKKISSTQNLPLHELKFPVKNTYFLRLKILVPRLP